MDTNANTNIFEVSITQEGAQYLNETAKWGKILAVVGFIISGLFIMGGFLVMFIGSSFMESLGPSGGVIGTVAGFIYLLLGVVYIYPSLKLLRFCNAMPEGLRSGDQQTVTMALKNLKSVFKFWGLLTLIIIGIYGLIILLTMVFGATSRF
jgi:hypothetical protein